MPGPVAAAEREERAVRGHYLGSIVLHVRRRSENAKPTAWSGPMFVEVYQHRDYLGFGVGMYLPITPLRILANCRHPAVRSQIHVEFIRHSLTEIVTLEIAGQVTESRSRSNLMYIMGCGTLNGRIISVDRP